MQVQFKINKAETKMGQSAFIIGSHPLIGSWDSKKCPRLTTSGQYPRWQTKDMMVFSSK
jgi:hypothetical protein